MTSVEAEFYRLRSVLAAELRRLRSDAKQTQERAAELLHIAPRHLQKLEAGEVNVTLRTLVKLSVAYGVEPASLLRRRNK